MSALPLPDLAQCAAEPIRVPGAIQPHGRMAVLDARDGRLLALSANWTGEQQVREALSMLPVDSGRLQPGRTATWLGSLPLDGRTFDVTAHLQGGRILVEYEAGSPGAGMHAPIYAVARDVLPLLSGDLRPEMVEALRRVKQSFKTGCITNNLPANAIGSKTGRSLYVAEVMALFDHVIESAKIGLRKPDPRIYTMMTDKLGVDPKRCVYLDDLGVNLKPAREMGMTTIKVLNAPQAIAELEAATGLALR